MTPLRLLELFFDHVLVDMIVDYTKLYSHREKTDISFETTKNWLFLSMLLLSGCHHFQTVKCIGKQPPTSIPQCFVMPRNTSMPRKFQLLVLIYLWISISHAFVCLPTLELTTFEQQVRSTRKGYTNALSLGTNSCKKSAHQVKKQ